MSYKTLSFFGHREINISDELIGRLKNLIEDLIINENFGYFYFGGFGDFDNLCYQIVSSLKTKYPFITRIYVYENEKYLRKKPNYLYNEEYESFEYFEPKFKYWYTSIYYRNIEIIDRSDKIIFYVEDRENSGAKKSMSYAKSIKKDYINIAN